jgi:hypothetical protein
VLRVRTVFPAVPGGPWYSNFHFSGDTQAAAGAAHASVVDFWASLAENLWTDIAGTVEAEVMEIDPVSGDPQQAFTVQPATVEFTNSAEPIPFANQGLITFNTGLFFGGRRLKGRTFIPGLCEPDITYGSLSSGIRTQLDTAAALLINIGDTSTLQVWSRRHQVARDVTSATTAAKPAILRSRRD